MKLRKVEDTSHKLSKTKLDIHFLTCYKHTIIFTDFLIPKLYRKHLYKNGLHHDFKRELLNFGIENKCKTVKHLENALALSWFFMSLPPPPPRNSCFHFVFLKVAQCFGTNEKSIFRYFAVFSFSDMVAQY